MPMPLRLVRAFRGREKILKFEGGYHGMSDWALMSLAPKRLANFPVPVPDSRAFRAACRTRSCRSLQRRRPRRQHDPRIRRQLGCDRRAVPAPDPPCRLPAGAARVTAELGIPLIFDEVVTGSASPYGGAQEHYGVVRMCAPWARSWARFPLSAIAGRADIMAQFDRAASVTNRS